jgi:hypothetical protein
VNSAAVFDPIRDRLLVIGGWGGSRRPETWALNLAGAPEWQIVPAAGAAGVSDHSAIYDAVRDRVVVFGGTRSNFTNETWSLNLTGAPEWTLLNPGGTLPGNLHDHTAVHDLVGDRMLVTGGYGSSGTPIQTWALSLSGGGTWTLLAPTRQPPRNRWDHSAVMDTRRRQMVIFGGHGP